MPSPTDVRLNEAELAALRQFRTVHGGAERRRHVRHNLPESFPLVVRLTPAGSPPQALSVSPRDISASGMGFYNTGYIHVGTPCHVVMKTIKGEPTGLRATVVRCRHVSGRIHEVGVLFEHEVDLGQFVQGGTVPATREESDVQAKVAALVQDLHTMVDQHAAMTGILAKVAELAVVLEPFQSKAAPPCAQPSAAPAAPATPAP